MLPPRTTRLVVILAFVLCSTGCGYSIWPWGNRENPSSTEPKRETKQEKCERLVRELSDAAVSIRRSDLLELEGAAIVGAQGGDPDAAAQIAGRASRVGQSASLAYVAALKSLIKCSPSMVDSRIFNFAYENAEKQKLLNSMKPLIISHLKRARLGLPLQPTDCAQDLQAARYMD